MYLVDDRLNAFLPYLHIPIDNIILNGVKQQSNYLSLQKLVPTCRPWSKLDDYSTYMSCQSEWRNVFNQPLLNEFRLWNEWRAVKSNLK